MKSQQDFDKKLIEIELALLLDSKPEITRAHRLLRPKTMAYWTASHRRQSLYLVMRRCGWNQFKKIFLYTLD